ncbi:MAG: hypothetical protein HKO73_11500 [Woeseiaceae bacterium]|nr:hypothetical protein [Woeseiaceae bacterium]
MKHDIAAMEPVVTWLDQLLAKTLQPGLRSRFNPLPKLFSSSSTELTSAD